MQVLILLSLNPKFSNGLLANHLQVTFFIVIYINRMFKTSLSYGIITNIKR